MNGLESIFLLLGRLAVAAFFLWMALEKVKHWNEASDYLRKKKIPHISYVMPVAVVLQIVGGLSIASGWMPRLGAFLLLVYMVPHTYFIHDFWKMGPGEGRTVEKLFFMKDLAIIGALLVILAVGGGHFGISH